MASSSLFLVVLLVIVMHPQQLVKGQQNDRQLNRDDLAVAIQEMQRASYYTFVTLINMWSPHAADIISNASGTITFFMPKDRALSDFKLSNSSLSDQDDDAIISDFLLRHSVPSALLFDHLLRLPTASVLPTSLPNYMVQIQNGGGRSNFFLNNIKLSSPNLCTATATIRCHGIAGVLPTLQQQQQDTTTNNSSSCSSSSTNPLSSPSPSPISSPIYEIINIAPAAAPSPAHPHKSAATSTISKSFVESCILLCFSIIIYAM